MRKLLNEELGRMNTTQFKAVKKIPLVVVLDNVRSMNNIGSVFRTSDAFRINEIILCGITATPPHKEIHKTALGATDSVAWSYFDDTITAIRQLKEQGYVICAVEQAEGSVKLESFTIDSDRRYALIFGHELKGVEQVVMDNVDFCIEIPQYGTKHSLNVSVSAGIILWDFFKKMRKLI